MSLAKIAMQRFPRLSRTVGGWVAGWNRTGWQMAFYAKTIGETRLAIRQYKNEIVRLIAGMSMGTGALAVIGGTVVIIGFLTLPPARSSPCRGISSCPASVWRR